MSHASHSTIERHCDVAIIGGSAAGLAAALQLGRLRRSVIVIDSGEPRNEPAEHLRSFLGYEGKAPGDLLAVGRDEVRSYGGEILTGHVETVTKGDDGKFVVHLSGGNSVVARRVIAATGLADHLPDIPGMREQGARRHSLPVLSRL
ncbi:FAD-dependent oxidoreductase [Ornithinimicrobium sp. INDO-MA30-4]|uniref:FAD-dependent oxidoreductase n=1 Tax=Ornithinimicrobium sp. INDO-MA30-4 TaxID=2908651 RepID=UPI001F34C613|nr:FAD-dependent oxidoreductase [Ornithinimicrobium sp. INDO-MA30-4]UJH69987.1 FAD-dependent oxidoreductase [Ornithinimicrobium sp. INDO-MA30-4]